MGLANRQLAIMQLSLKQMWIYKFDFFMFAVSGPLRILVYYFLWRAIYSSFGQAVIRGFTFDQMAAYYVLGLVLQIVTWNLTDREMAKKVKFGDLTRDLVKPYHFFSFRLSQVAGYRILAVIIQVPMIILLGIFFFNFQVFNYVHLALFVAALVLAYLLSHAIVFLFGLSAFWLKEYRGVHTLRHGIIMLFSGAIIPLSFFPDTAQKVFSFLPFQYLLYIPILIFNGQLSINQSLVALAVAAAWVVGLMIICLWLWRRALKKFTGVGA